MGNAQDSPYSVHNKPPSSASSPVMKRGSWRNRNPVPSSSPLAMPTTTPNPPIPPEPLENQHPPELSQLSQSQPQPPPQPQHDGKKKFSVVSVTLPPCFKCSRGVDKLELCKDGKDQIFHKSCLRCCMCNKSLARREMVPIGALRISHDQFAVDDVRGDYFCDVHNPVQDVKRKSSIKSQDIDQKYVGDTQLKELGFSRKESNAQAKLTLENSGGLGEDLTCSRCGNAISKTHRMVQAGLLRYHEICPSQEEVDKMNQSLKFFLKKLPERLAITLYWDGQNHKQCHTFLYCLDRDLWKRAYLSTQSCCTVQYFPDPESLDAVVTRFVRPTGAPQFDIKVKHYPAYFQFKDVRNDYIHTPVLENDLLTLKKCSNSNGVHQELEVRFLYQDSQPSDPIQADVVEFRFEKNESDVDPLAALRAKKKKSMAEQQPIHLSDTLFASLDEPKHSIISEDEEFDPSDPKSIVRPSLVVNGRKKPTGVLLQQRRSVFEQNVE